MKDILAKLLDKENLTYKEMKQATEYCLSDASTDTEISALLTGLKIKGETAEEMAGMADVIRAQSDISDIALQNVMDNCGTGGDRSNSFNISTTAAFILAGAGVTVAKHGNRSISSKTGSADVLESLGVRLDFPKEDVEIALKENQISFLFAPHVHTKLRPFMKIRKELGLPTIFNFIGPLTNPIFLDSQLVGVYKRDKLETIAEALKTLGRKRAIVLNGAGHMDEASLQGNNHLVLLENDTIKTFTVHPDDVGLPVYDNDEIRGGTAEKNAEILLSVLKNEASPYLDTAVFNAAIGLYAHGKVESIKAGVALAQDSIASGKALDRLNYLIEYSKKLTSEAAVS